MPQPQLKRALSCLSVLLFQPEVPALDRVFDRITSCIGAHSRHRKRMAFQSSQISELLVQSRDRSGVGKGISTSCLATLDRLVEIRTKDDVMESGLNTPERIEKPRPYDAIHNYEIPAFSIARRRAGENVQHGKVLFMRFGQPWRYRTCFDEVPEVVRV